MIILSSTASSITHAADAAAAAQV